MRKATVLRAAGWIGVPLSLALLTVSNAASAQPTTKLVAPACDRMPEDEWLTKPTVDVLYYQGPCNPMLVPGRDAMVRVYINWRDWENRKGLPDYYATVQLTAENGPVQCQGTPSFPVQVLKQRLYDPVHRRKAENSINFFGCDLGGVKELTAKVELGASPDVAATEAAASQPRRVSHMSRETTVLGRVVFPTVGSWRNGVPADAMQKARDIINDGAQFAVQNLPIFEVEWYYDAGQLELLEPPEDPDPGLDPSILEEEWSVKEVPCSETFEELPNEKCRTFVEEDLFDDDELAPEDWLRDELETLYGDHPLVVAVVPKDFQGGWRGITRPRGWNPPGCSADQNTLGVQCRVNRLMILRTDAIATTVAHEIGHYLGLPHHNGIAAEGSLNVEGFLATSTGGVNKSTVEGNGDPEAGGKLISLMAREPNDLKLGNAARFIMNGQYKALQEDLEKTPLEPTAYGGAPPLLPHPALSAANVGWGTSSVSSWSPAALTAATETPVLIRGRIRTDGTSARLAPLEWSPTRLSGEPTAGTSTLRFLDAQGARLRSVPVATDDPPGFSRGTVESSSTGFAVVTDIPEGAARLQLVDSEGSVLAEIVRPSSPPPQVRITSPTSGASWRPGMPVQWEVTGDGGSRASIYYSPDGGTTWGPKGIRLPAAALRLSDLRPGPEPTLVVAVTDGFNIAADTVRFSIEAEPQPLGRSPSPGDTVPPGAEVQVTFNTDFATDAVGRAVLVSGIDGQSVAGETSLRNGGSAVTFTPNQPLTRGQTYRVQVPEGLQDRYGNRSGSDQVWTFHVEPDADRPRVAGVFPRDGALAIPRDTSFTVQFSEAMAPGNGETIRVLGPNEVVSGSVSWADGTRTAVFTPGAPLEGSTLYRVQVLETATDPAGNAVEPAEWSFTTVADFSAAPANPPTVASSLETAANATPDTNAWADVLLEGPNLTLEFPEDAGAGFRSSPQRVRGNGSSEGVTARGDFDLGMRLSPNRTAGCGFSQSISVGLQRLAGGGTLDGEIRLNAGPGSVEVALEFDQGTIAARADSPGQISVFRPQPGRVRVEVRGATFELRLDQGSFSCPNLLDFGFTLSEGR